MGERQFAYCCAAFAAQAMELQALAGGGFAYPSAMHPHSQFEPDAETDTWNINGCCGGGCFVVTDMRFCPYCGARLVNPISPTPPDPGHEQEAPNGGR